MSKSLSWTPVRRGHVYCSSGCGSDCTWAAYQKAKRKAAALAKKLGPAWKPHVWENMGWHYQSIMASASVSPIGNVGYHADVHVGNQFMASDKDPRKALTKAFALCCVDMEERKRNLVVLGRALS